MNEDLDRVQIFHKLGRIVGITRVIEREVTDEALRIRELVEDVEELLNNYKLKPYEYEQN